VLFEHPKHSEVATLLVLDGFTATLYMRAYLRNGTY